MSEIKKLLALTMAGDYFPLRRALPKGAARLADLPEALAGRLQKSVARRAQRLADLPKPEFPEELPVNLRRQEIAEAIRQNQVVIICGETGSGKTTQLPKICLEVGRGVSGLIGHTQPRRIAARATATRIAEELHSELGKVVGYKIRFTDRLSPESYVKLMTDGILLAETQGDPLLAQYDTLIIDEAHERSLNIDFLLGYLKEILPRRPDLKVIVTSATLDAERFSRHFNNAPVIEVSGRLYPIEVRYRPLDEKERDLSLGIVEAVDEAQRLGPGDVLVFLPGEREIREAAEALRKHHPPGTEILPLFARQSAQEQGRVFSRSNGRRVVLATNVAETSLTVPGIRYVVDSGLARVKRYSIRNKVEQLQVEPVAQSAAKQRAGRCGRVMSGVCFRLYEEDDYNKRPAHTDPEILRSSLAGVILRMKSLGLKAVEDFPFLDAPLPRAVADGYQLLSELGAVDEGNNLTKVGRELAKLPLDPKIGRMILAARDKGCLREMLVIAAALASQDPRERPQEQSGTADQAHARFRGPTEADQRSEFLWYWHCWQAFDQVWQHESSNKQKQWSRQHFLNYLRMREWRDVHGQLHALAAEHGWRENDKPAAYEPLHQALLAGLLGHIGLKSEEEAHYLGARGIRFFPHPGSALAKKAGKWIVAGELVDTSRLFGRCLARVEPEWLEEVGAHLVKKHVYEPHWEKGAGAVIGFERATLHGITLYARRRVQFGPLDPKLARQVFIREALVQGQVPEDFPKRAPFFRHNMQLVAEIEKLEHKRRRPDVLVDESLIQAFYEALVPEAVYDLRAFDAWRREVESAKPKLLFLDRDQLMRHEAAGVTTDNFPPSLLIHGQPLKLSYHHEPGAADDGVTLTVPLAMLNQIPAARCDWLVPGMLEQKVMALVKTVPQKIRHRLMPLAEYVAEFCGLEHDPSQPLEKVLARHIEEKVGLKLPIESLRSENLPPHYGMNFRVQDQHGRILGQSRDLADLRSRLGAKVESAFAAAALKVGLDSGAKAEPAKPAAEPAQAAKSASSKPGQTGAKSSGAAEKSRPSSGETQGEAHSGLTTWSFGELPELLEVTIAGREVIGFPGLVDEGDSVALRAFDTPEKALAAHRAGLRRLFALELKEQVKFMDKNLPGLRDMAMQFMNLGTEAELRQQLVAATLERTCMMEPWPTDAAAFNQRKDQARGRITLVSQEMARLAGNILNEYTVLNKRLVGLKAYPTVAEDIKNQINALVSKDFILAQPFERLAHYPRYLKAANLRIDKLRNDPDRDNRHLADWNILAKPWERERLARLKAGVPDPALEEFRWLLEELRVNLFAQELKTPMPVSLKRLQKIWESRSR